MKLLTITTDDLDDVRIAWFVIGMVAGLALGWLVL